MITIAIDPVMLTLGTLSLRWNGLAVCLAVLGGAWLIARTARGRGLAEDDVYRSAVWVVIGGFVGARAFHVLDHLDFYLANPRAAVDIQAGGLALWGALAGGLVAAAFATRLSRTALLPLLDATPVGLLAGQAIGRIGSLINGDAWGLPTGGQWGLVYTQPRALVPADLLGVPTQPVPLYEIGWCLASLVLFWRWRYSRRPSGQLFALYLVSHALGRLLIGFARGGAPLMLGLQQAQVIAIVVMLVALAAAWRRSRARRAFPIAGGGLGTQW